MRVLLINPNTSEAFTSKIQQIAEKYALPGTQVRTVNPKSGPRSIEGVYDELLSSVPTLEVALADMDCDALVVACYSDHPTIYALREITDKPVLGIAEASMHVACMVGNRFSIVTTNKEWEPLLRDAVRRYGMIERCSSVRSTGMPVLALESASQEDVYRAILSASRQAIETDAAEVICLGCAGMAGLDKRLEAELHIPVVDGVVAALKLLEALGGYGLKTSKLLTYARPKWKTLANLPQRLEQAYDPSSIPGKDAR
jgi:allantoin racemase